jgi:hypothetical protein
VTLGDVTRSPPLMCLKVRRKCRVEWGSQYWEGGLLGRYGGSTGATVQDST